MRCSDALIDAPAQKVPQFDVGNGATGHCFECGCSITADIRVTDERVDVVRPPHHDGPQDRVEMSHRLMGYAVAPTKQPSQSASTDTNTASTPPPTATAQRGDPQGPHLSTTGVRPLARPPHRGDHRPMTTTLFCA